MSNQKLIAQGAEAKIYLDNQKIIKQRIPKAYRHSVLDEQIRRRRTKTEARILEKAAQIINVPKLIKTEKFAIEIEYICGDKLSEKLNSYGEGKQFSVMRMLGEQTAKLHSANIIHSDLTTSNAILKDDELFIIDFGLSFVSSKTEDKAVDLHLIKQALEAKHYQNHNKLFENFIRGYEWKDAEKVVERLKIVERRGRYKH